MLCRAIIESVLGSYKVKVRIPSIHKGETSVAACPQEDVPMSIVSVPAGIYPALKLGDTVLVGFENDNIDKPVVIGLLFNDKCKSTTANGVLNSLEVKVNSKLPYDTTIGNVSKQSLSYLQGLDSNAQKQLDSNKSAIKNIDDNGCTVVDSILQQLNALFDGELSKKDNWR